jgi:hypothetical protein
MKAPPPVHVLIADIVGFHGDNFTPPELAEILGCHRNSVTEAIRKGWLEGTMTTMRGLGEKPRYQVQKAAAVLWIWRNTTGNRDVLRETLAEKAPHILRMIQRVETAETKAAETTARPLPRTRPANQSQGEFCF